MLLLLLLLLSYIENDVRNKKPFLPLCLELLFLHPIDMRNNSCTVILREVPPKLLLFIANMLFQPLVHPQTHNNRAPIYRSESSLYIIISAHSRYSLNSAGPDTPRLNVFVTKPQYIGTTTTAALE